MRDSYNNQFSHSDAGNSLIKGIIKLDPISHITLIGEIAKRHTRLDKCIYMRKWLLGLEGRTDDEIWQPRLLCSGGVDP